jgi:hypothetical protein
MKKSILACEAGRKFLSGHDGVADVAAESMFEMANGLRQWPGGRATDYENVDVAASVLLISRERTVEPRFVDSIDFHERFGDRGGCADRF